MAGVDLATICARLKLVEKDVLNVYLLGSRLWGTAGPESDWDFLVVVRDKAAVLAKAPKRFLNVHTGNYDAMILSQSFFVEKMTDYTSSYEMIVTWLPAESMLILFSLCDH